MLISYYIMVIFKTAAKMAAVTLKLAYLLNYLLQISRECVYHWAFWRHIYLYQIKVHILMSSRNPRWLPVYKHWYFFFAIQSCLCSAHGQHNVQQCKLFCEVVAILKYELYNMLLVVCVRIQILNYRTFVII